MPLQVNCLGIAKKCPSREQYPIAGLIKPYVFALALTPATPLPCKVTWPLISTKSPSFISWLAFARVDVILSEQFGPLRQDAEVVRTSGTAEIVKVSKNDHELSLRGPLGS